MKKYILALILTFTFTFPTTLFAQTATVKITPAEKKIAEMITAEQLRDYLYFVASDEMEGRDTPSRGLDLTAKFIALQLKRWGLTPAGDEGTFFQRFAISYDTLDGEQSVFNIGSESLKLGEDYFRLTGSGGVENAPLVYGGTGWRVDSKKIDDLAGVGVKGKIVVLYSKGFPNPRTLTNPPDEVADKDLQGKNGDKWSNPLTNAIDKGAVGIIVVPSPQVMGRWEDISRFLSRGNSYPAKLKEKYTAGETPIPVTLVSQSVSEQIFAGESGNVTSKAFDINKRASIKFINKTETKYTQNVVAVWEGIDAKLKNEYVAIGAHYDHVGVRPDAQGVDKIWNGADDDGSGTVAVLSIAETLAKAPVKPKRSVLFVWHTGEEKGLWGSEYFNAFPTVDIKNVVTQLNIDMIGRSKIPGYLADCDKNLKPNQKPCNGELSKADEIYVIGSEMMSSTLGAVTKQANDSYLKLDYNYKYDDPKDPNGFFFRSDHFNYAVNGIPIVFWFDGVHEDYHGPGDEPEKIDYQKMEKVTRTIFLTLWEIADLKERPKVDKELPKELTQR